MQIFNLGDILTEDGIDYVVVKVVPARRRNNSHSALCWNKDGKQLIRGIVYHGSRAHTY